MSEGNNTPMTYRQFALWRHEHDRLLSQSFTSMGEKLDEIKEARNTDLKIRSDCQANIATRFKNLYRVVGVGVGVAVLFGLAFHVPWEVILKLLKILA